MVLNVVETLFSLSVPYHYGWQLYIAFVGSEKAPTRPCRVFPPSIIKANSLEKCAF